MSKLIDLTDKVFGRLTVINRAKNAKQGQARWSCICICGNNTVSTSRSLLVGTTRSCGCLNKETISKKMTGKSPVTKKAYKESSFNHMYRNYQYGAKKRNLKWNLTKDQFKQLTSSICYYCGIEPYNEYRSTKSFNGFYIYNGIDRVDNNKGYVPENCLPCCKFCNRAKFNLLSSEFIENIKRIYKHLNL